MTLMSKPALAEATGESPGTFEDFFHQHQRRLFHAMWLLTRDRHDAEELAQEAFLRLWV